MRSRSKYVDIGGETGAFRTPPPPPPPLKHPGERGHGGPTDADEVNAFDLRQFFDVRHPGGPQQVLCFSRESPAVEPMFEPASIQEPYCRSTGGSLMSAKRFLVVAMAALVSVSAIAADGQKSSGKAKKDDSEAADKAAKASAAAESQSDEKAPRLTIVEPVKDYGTVPKGDKLEWAFLVKNTGDADLQIIAAKPGCGCTVADFDKVIKPGATGKVTAHVDTTAFAGPISKSVTLETNDPNTPTAQLTLHAIVKPFVEAY